jgi:hypothetical protein
MLKAFWKSFLSSQLQEYVFIFIGSFWKSFLSSHLQSMSYLCWKLSGDLSLQLQEFFTQSILE